MNVEVFISYQRADARYAQFLGEQIQAAGVAVWWDKDIGVGAEWREDIITALEASPVVILLFSDAAQASEEVRKEVAVASSLKKKVIAVRLENRPPKGAFLYEMARLNWYDAFVNTEQRLTDLARALSGLRLSDMSSAQLGKTVGARSLRRPALARLAANNIFLLALFIAISAIGVLAYEHYVGGISQQIEAGAPQLVAIAYAAFATSIGAPFLLLASALHPLARAPMLAVGLANTLVLLLLFRNFVMAIGRALQRQFTAAQFRRDAKGRGRRAT